MPSRNWYCLYFSCGKQIVGTRKIQLSKTVEFVGKNVILILYKKTKVEPTHQSIATRGLKINPQKDRPTGCDS